MNLSFKKTEIHTIAKKIAADGGWALANSMDNAPPK